MQLKSTSRKTAFENGLCLSCLLQYLLTILTNVFVRVCLYPDLCTLTYFNVSIGSNSVKQDETAPTCANSSRSTLFDHVGAV